MNILQSLGIKDLNQGASTDKEHWYGDGKKIIQSINPANEELIAQVQGVSKNTCEKIIQQAHETFLEWRQIPSPKRGELIRQFANILREKKEVLGSLVSMEMGKSKREGIGEVQEMIDMADFAVGQSRMLYGRTMHSERPAHRMYEQWHPYGVTLVITAFNFPVAVWAWNAFIAAIAGNTIIWKPSSKVPLCAIAVQNICNEVMANNGYRGIFSLIIPEDNIVAQSLLEDERIPLVSFTGSTEVGREIADTVTKRFARVILECGGNNGIIVDKSADLSLAIPAIVFGAIGTAGQRCTTTRRLFIHQEIMDIVVKKLLASYQQISIGDPMDAQNLMGSLVDDAAVKMYLAAIEKIKQQGGEIIFGGHAIKKRGFFVKPCIVKVTHQLEIMYQETFAPILYLMAYKDLAEAMRLHNEVKQGLSSAIFTQDLAIAEYFLSAMGSDCGIANVNIGTSGAEIGGAFGGEKETGGGREAGSDAWKAYMRRQTNTINWSKELPLAQGINFSIE